MKITQNILSIALILLGLEQSYAQSFTKITSGDIVNNGAVSLGAIWGDYDNDGDPDLFVPNVGGANNFLYQNNGDGSFTRITSGVVVSDQGNSINATWGDYDNDKDLDLYVTNAGEDNFLYQNNGDGTFNKNTASIVIGTGNQGCAWGDFDADGWLDLFVSGANGEDNALYKNNGDGTFTSLSSNNVVTAGGNSMGANWVDFDNDDDLDLFIVNHGEANRLFINDGTGAFTLLNDGSEIATDVEDSWSASWADYNNDGWVDLIVANKQQANSLYKNNNGVFTKVIEGDLGGDTADSEGTTWGDFNNDGWLDLYVGNSNNEVNLLYLNNGDGTFASQVGHVTTSDANSTTGTAWADYDLDGDIDLFLADAAGNNFLFRNNASGNNYLDITLIGVNQNAFGVGARVQVEFDEGPDTWFPVSSVSTQTGNRGQNSSRLHFGLGAATSANEVTVYWPNGTVESFSNVAANQNFVIKGLGPNLEITTSSTNYSYIKAGGRITLASRVRNTGDFSSSYTSIGFFLSEDQNYDDQDVLLGYRDLASLSASAFSPPFQSSPTVPANTAPGSYYVLFVVDYEDKVTETDEDDNIADVALEVVDFDLPDLQVSGFFFDPKSLNPGQSFDITDGVLNNGTADATGVEVQFVLSEDVIVDAGDQILGTVTTDFPAGVSTTVSATLTIPPGTPRGEYYLLEIVDRNDDFTELDETNNTDSFTDDQVIIVSHRPSPPTDLTAALSNNDTQADLAWVDNPDVAQFEEEEFVITRNGSDYAFLAPNTESFSDFSMTPGESYEYQVYAYRNDEPGFIDINGNVTSVIGNPVSGGINTSSHTVQVDRSTDALSGFYIDMPFTMHLGLNAQYSMKVYSPVAGATIRFKLEDSSNPADFFEVDQTVTSATTWEELNFDFSGGEDETYDRLTIFFDFNTTTANTFYFDDVVISDQTLDFETGQLQVRVESERSNLATVYVIDPDCTFDIPTNVTWTGTPQNDPFGCLGADPGGNDAIVITDQGDGTFRISDLMARAYKGCGTQFDVDETAIFSNPCNELSLSALGASWQFGPDGPITYDEGTQTLTIPYKDLSNNVSHVTVLTANATGVLPFTPFGLVAEGISDSQVSLEWEASFNADTYTIERSTTPSSGFSFLVTISAASTKYLDASGLVEGTTYYYRIKANNAEGESPYSNEASAVPVIASFEKIVSGELVESTSGQGSAWGDYDNDGDLDLFTPTFTGLPNFFFENNGDGTFTRKLEGVLVEDTVVSRSASWADVNNDGFLDLFVANSDTESFMFINNGDTPPTFTKNTMAAADSRLQTSAFADFNNDGFVDLFTGADLANNIMFVNNGDGTFDELGGSPLSEDGAARSWGAAWADYDLDGDLDLFVANRFGQQDLFYENNGDGTFTAINNELTIAVADSRTPSWGDYDNDGDPDLFVGTPDAFPNLFYRNNGDGSFTKITSGLVVDNQVLAYGSAWGDYNNDGWQDLFVAAIGNNKVYTNNGDGTFSVLIGEPLVDNTDFTIGGSFGDFNNDGFLDIMVPNTGGISNDLYSNNGTSGNHYINIALVGTVSNTSAIGAKVYVTAGGITQYQEVSGQTGYGSQNSLNLEFGVGSATTIDEVRVEWPMGTSQSKTDVSADQFVTIYEDNSGPEISLVNVLDVFSDDTGGKFEADATDISGVASVELLVRGTAADPEVYSSSVMTAGSQADRYELPLTIDMFDELGLTAFVRATDNIGNVSTSDTVNIYLSFIDTDATLTGLQSGTEESDYQIFSIPVDLDQQGVAAVFSELGAYDKSQWRVFHYENGENVEFQSGLTNIERGKGYWLIAKSVNASIQAGSGDNALSNDEPFAIELAAGWNQIGNPYAYNVSWQNVLDYNGITSGTVSELYVYESGYSTSDRLESYEGGFVEAQNAMTLRVPIRKNSSVQGGRKMPTGRQQGETFDPQNWQLDLKLSAGELVYDVAGVGMSEFAKEDRDRFDRSLPPRFIKYLDLKFDKENINNLTKDVVEAQESYVWKFVTESNMDEELVRLQWETELIAQSANKMILYDVEAEKVVDMAIANSYKFANNGSRTFEIFYGTDEFVTKSLKPASNGFGQSYPNPFSESVTIPFRLNDNEEAYAVEIAVYNVKGEKIRTLVNDQHITPGFYSAQWSVGDASEGKLDKGLYLVRLIVDGKERQQYFTRLILK